MRIHCLHEGAYLQCRTWLIEGPDSLVVVDPGSGCEAAAVLRNLRALGFSREAVSHVLLTHCHGDHAMGAADWQAQGAAVGASARCAMVLGRADPVVWGEHPESVPKIRVDLPMAEGETLALGAMRLRALSTPGHTRGSMTYLAESDGNRIAFTGDLLMANGHPGWAGKGEYDADALVRSLEKLRPLGIAAAYPGHGEPIADVGAWLDQGLAEARAGRWHPETAWKSTEVPACFRK